jgi:hypothetical protein
MFISSNEHKVSNKNSSECMKETIPQSPLKSDLNELYTPLKVDKPLEIFAFEYGVCNVCHEISAAVSGEDILMPQIPCVEIQANSTTLEFDTKNVDFSHKQPWSIVEKLLVEPLIKPSNMQLSLTIYASLPPNLADS